MTSVPAGYEIVRVFTFLQELWSMENYSISDKLAVS